MGKLMKIPISIVRPLYERTSFHRSVIDEISEEALKPAYSHCRAITRFHAKTFYLATRFLPNEKQRSIFAIYGLCRYLDDMVDETMDLAQNQKVALNKVDYLLEEFRQELHTIYAGYKNNSTNPILTAFADTLKKYHIPIELPLELMDGVRSDLVKNRIQNFEELYQYSYKVASVVGLMTSRVFGYSDEKALEYAIDLGIAMQLTNILRDVGEDLNRKRIYLPQDEMKMFGVSERDLFTGQLNGNFKKLMKFQIARARNYYKRCDTGIKMLSRDSRLPVYLARYNYGRILDKIEKNDFNVFGQRAYLNKMEKLSILPKIMFQMQVAS
jgi:phytoene synthase